MLRRITRMWFAVALALVCLLVLPEGASAQCPSAGGGARFGILRPFKKLRERFQERRAERSGAVAQADPGYEAADASGYATVLPVSESAVSYETDIPAPAQYKTGAIAVYDGKVWRLVGDNSPVDIRPVPARAAQYQTVVPAGYHAHQRQDGTVIVHGDENFGDPVAHAGIARPWPKIATAGQTVRGAVVQPRAQRVIYGSSCPGGVCPVR